MLLIGEDMISTFLMMTGKNDDYEKSIINWLFLMFCLSFVLAQEPKIFGDWIGIAYKTILKEHPVTGNLIQVDEKLYIRIIQIDVKYQVRMKSQIADGSRPFSYLPECKVTLCQKTGLNGLKTGATMKKTIGEQNRVSLLEKTLK